MNEISPIIALTLFPGGLFVMLLGLFYLWINRKLVARLQNRIGPRWFQPYADVVKLLVKEEIIPADASPALFVILPVLALAGVLTAALYVPLFGLASSYSFPGDLIVTVYLLSLLTMCTGLAGANSTGRFSLVGVTRTLTQLFSYEAPFLLALLSPAIMARSWQISDIIAYADGRWLMFTHPISFVIALVALMGKLEMPPFDAPEAETEIVAGAMTEYSGRGLALFKLGHGAELVIGVALVTALFMGGTTNPLIWLAQTAVMLVILALVQVLMARLRIDQTVGLWWRYGSVLAIVQIVILIVWERIVA
mgnify:CR=1 FL=1